MFIAPAAAMLVAFASYVQASGYELHAWSRYDLAGQERVFTSSGGHDLDINGHSYSWNSDNALACFRLCRDGNPTKAFCGVSESDNHANPIFDKVVLSGAGGTLAAC